MKDFPPNINWNLSTLIATVLGFLATDDFTALEQIAIGNWIIQIGQTMITNATYQELIESRILGSEKLNLNSREFKIGGSPFINPPNVDINQLYEILRGQISQEEIINFQKALQKLSDELEKLRK